MFKVEFFVDDKYLAEALRGIAGKAKQLQVVPVVNVVEEKDTKGRPNGKLRGDASSTLGLFLKTLKESTGDEPVTGKHAAKALGKIGLSPTSRNHFLNSAVKAGLMKKHGKGNGTTYSWV